MLKLMKSLCGLNQLPRCCCFFWFFLQSSGSQLVSSRIQLTSDIRKACTTSSVVDNVIITQTEEEGSK